MSKRYFPIQGSLKELKLEADYAPGGTNIFNGKKEPRGLYVYFNVVERSISDGGLKCESMELLAKSNFKMFALPLGRKNQKRLDQLEAYLDEYQSEMAELYRSGQHDTLLALVQQFAAPEQVAA